MRRHHGAALLFAAVLLIPTGCGGAKSPSTPAAPGKPDKVNAGVIAILDVAPIYLGKQKGIFSKHNIDLSLTTAQGGAAIVPAVLSGQFQFGISNVISLLLAQSKGIPIKVVSNGDNSTGVDGKDFASVLVKANSPIQRARDLAGKRVAANTLQNIVDTTVRESVRKDGGDPKSVKFVELPFPDMLPALDAGRVDAIFEVEPFQTQARMAGDRSIASSYVDAAPNLTVACYFTSNQLISTNPDLVKRFTAAMQESLAYADSHPDEVRAVLPSYTKIPPNVLSAMTLPRWPTDINRQSIQALGDLAVGDGLLAKQPDLNALLP